MKIKSAVFSTGLKLNSRVRISPSAPETGLKTLVFKPVSFSVPNTERTQPLDISRSELIIKIERVLPISGQPLMNTMK